MPLFPSFDTLSRVIYYLLPLCFYLLTTIPLFQDVLRKIEIWFRYKTRLNKMTQARSEFLKIQRWIDRLELYFFVFKKAINEKQKLQYYLL